MAGMRRHGWNRYTRDRFGGRLVVWIGAASAAPGTITVVDFGFENAATGENTVTINAGETVSFSYPTGTRPRRSAATNGRR